MNWGCDLSSTSEKEILLMAIINGRRIIVPPAGITGQNLIQQVNPGPGRRPVIQQGVAFRPIQPGYTYKPAELFDKHGNPVKITTIPDRTKGMVTYGGERTSLSKQIITEQVYDIAEKLFKKGVSFKEDIPLSVNGHLYQTAYHDACSDPLTQGWKWYCVYINAGSWQPAPVMHPGDWRKGDSLWTYFTLISEVLSGTDE